MQTSWIAASLLVAFVIFITVRGELPEYIAVFTGTETATTTKPNLTGIREKLGFPPSQ